MASLFKFSGSPYWYVQVTLPNGDRLPRKSTREKNKRDAERRAAEIEADLLTEFRKENLDQGRAFHRIVENSARLAEEGKLTVTRAEAFIRELRTLANPDHREVSLSEFYDGWIRTELAGLSASYTRNQKGSLAKWKAALGKLADAPMSEITVGDLDRAFAKIREGVTAATANGHLGGLRSVFTDAMRKGIVDQNPAALVKLVTKKKAAKKGAVRGPFTLPELRKLLKVADDEWRGFILCALQSGLRMMDIAKLTDANIDNGVLVVRSAKTDTATRTPLHPQLKAWIKGKRGSFFPTLSKKTNANLSTTFSNLMAKAGVEKKKTLPGGDTLTRSFHSLRHSFTSILADAGVDEETRMALTGQKDSKVHATYTHHGEDKLKAAIKHLPKL